MKTLQSRIQPLKQRTLSPVATERQRGRRGALARERVLKRDGYLCQSCLPGRIMPAVVVDHIVPLHRGGHDTDHNKQSLCLACHDIKSAIEEKQRNSPV